ncbi:unnamed protein product [Psylliodes chrysocephalus]|uniref:Uncharacterized protein n=1 Tax=Psylliodes chrysocephalus TaxID=3402493 RepID=A0A9P0GAS9_9CUCU|nr:unnamed protein product [Psylliodes chrysocephala]
MVILLCIVVSVILNVATSLPMAQNSRQKLEAEECKDITCFKREISSIKKRIFLTLGTAYVANKAVGMVVNPIVEKVSSLLYSAATGAWSFGKNFWTGGSGTETVVEGEAEKETDVGGDADKKEAEEEVTDDKGEAEEEVTDDKGEAEEEVTDDKGEAKEESDADKGAAEEENVEKTSDDGEAKEAK